MLRKTLVKDSQPILAEYSSKMLVAVPQFAQWLFQFGQVGYRLNSEWHMLDAKPAVKIGADTNMFSATSDLTNMIDCRRYILECDLLSRVAFLPAGFKKRVVRDDADHAMPFR